uniref:Uncharacterized protein n=1 Tax=Sphaerodactylus townsendi TaxID=933632 RepID=A0ACB8FTS1_9SAUR
MLGSEIEDCFLSESELEASLTVAAGSIEEEHSNPHLGSNALATPEAEQQMSGKGIKKSEEEERELLSDEEELHLDVPEQAARFLMSEDVIYLLAKSLVALGLQEPSDEDVSTVQPIKGTPTETSDKVFPLPEFFETQIRKKWVKPTFNKNFPAFIKKIYAFPEFANKMFQVPLTMLP